MLYRRFFFATGKGCQSKETNSWRKRVDNGRHLLNLNTSLFPKRHRKNLDETGKDAAELFSGKMNSPIESRSQTRIQLPKGTLCELLITLN
jgi:hypothetical protein